jgi:exopolyphosphatase/guanosine-5'-triphosphate,3'-diphosphate pyrophosphatase
MAAKCNIFNFGFRRRLPILGARWKLCAAPSLMSAPTRSSCWWPTCAGATCSPVHEESRQTRLGKGFYETHRLQPETIARTAEAVWEFAEIAREKNADSIRVIATSAARDAMNPTDLTGCHRTRVRLENRNHHRRARGRLGVSRRDHRCGTGETAAAAAGCRRRQHGIHFGHGAKKSFAHSFPLGTVRLMEKFPHSDPPTRGEFKPAATG